jgi:tubulin alpha
MVGKSMACDLKEKGIAVGLVHPGMVETKFADASKLPEQFAKMMRKVEPSTKGVIEAIESVNLENTGSFIHGNYGEGIKPCPW